MIFHNSKQKFHRKISIVFSDFYHDWKNIATIENRVSQLSACLNSITLRERNKGSPPRAIFKESAEWNQSFDDHKSRQRDS